MKGQGLAAGRTTHANIAVTLPVFETKHNTHRRFETNLETIVYTECATVHQVACC